MRWIDNPAEAPEDKNLVAIISLARDLCQHNRVGASGDPVRAEALPIETTAEWQILRETVYPRFNLQKFEQAMRHYTTLPATLRSSYLPYCATSMPKASN